MKSRMVLVTSCLLLLLAAVSLVRAEEEAKEPSKTAEVKKAVNQAANAKEPADPAKSAAKKGTPIALTVEAIQEIEQRKTALDEREKQLDERTRDLEVQEKILKEKLKKMEDLSRKMAERLETFKKDHEARINKLVNVVEGMKPDAAAQYVENLDADLAVEILSRIKEAKASKILNLVDKKKGARLTELYTGYRDSIDEPPANAPAPPPAGKEGQPNNKPM